MSNWARNKERAKYRETGTSLTDQGAAKDTDINIIVKRYQRSGMVPVGRTEPLYGDWTMFPPDLRGVIELARSGEQHRKNLPEALRGMSLEDLAQLTPEQLKEKLKPAETNTPPAKPAEEPK